MGELELLASVTQMWAWCSSRSTVAVAKGRGHTKPGSLLKLRIPMRLRAAWGEHGETWADHDENTPGYVEVGSSAAGR